MSPELIDLTSEFCRPGKSMSTSFVLPGNHEIATETIKHRLDSSFNYKSDNPNIHYIKDSIYIKLEMLVLV